LIQDPRFRGFWLWLSGSVLAVLGAITLRWLDHVNDAEIDLFSLVLSLGLTALGFYISFVIYGEQTRMSAAQAELQEQVMRRVFGTLTDFEEMHENAVSLIREANERKESDLRIMCYWLWFGADRVLRVTPSLPLSEVRAFHSGIRAELQIRATKGYKTTIVTYDPTVAKAQLTRFVVAAVGWQREKGQGSLSIMPDSQADIDSLIALYADDLQDLERDRGKRHTNGFKPLILKDSIPMLMFAATEPSGWSRALICLAEAEALEQRAEVGGFTTEDKRLVNVILGQIK
jgi:hypothetical protein